MKREVFELIKRIEKGIKYILNEKDSAKREKAEQLMIKLMDEFEEKIKKIEDEIDKEMLTKLFYFVVRR